MLKRETIHNTTDSAVDETGSMRLGTQKMVAGGIDDTDWWRRPALSYGIYQVVILLP